MGSPAAAVAVIGPITPTAGAVLIGPITAELLTLEPYEARGASPGVFCLSEVRYLALRYLEISGGRGAYTTTSSSTGYDGRQVVHYHFPDGYHTTSEDSAVDHLRSMLARLVRDRGYRWT